MKSLKPGHHIAKILLFRTHHLWNSTTELILVLTRSTFLKTKIGMYCTYANCKNRKLPNPYTVWWSIWSVFVTSCRMKMLPLDTTQSRLMNRTFFSRWYKMSWNIIWRNILIVPLGCLFSWIRPQQTTIPWPSVAPKKTFPTYAGSFFNTSNSSQKLSKTQQPVKE